MWDSLKGLSCKGVFQVFVHSHKDEVFGALSAIFIENKVFIMARVDHIGDTPRFDTRYLKVENQEFEDNTNLVMTL